MHLFSFFFLVDSIELVRGHRVFRAIKVSEDHGLDDIAADFSEFTLPAGSLQLVCTSMKFKVLRGHGNSINSLRSIKSTR